MRKTAQELRDEEAAQLAEVLCSDSTMNKAPVVLGDLDKDEVHELCTTILSNGHTIVHLLAQRQKLGSLRAVLQYGVDVHTRNAQGATPLHVALHHNALFSAKVLIDHGANVSEVVSRKKGTTLLHLMVTCDRPHGVMLLLEEKADANAFDNEGRTPFHLAAIYDNIAIAAILIRHEQCDVNAVDASGHTALMLAILNNNQELARQLVDAPRVDIVRRDHDGMSSLHLAVSRGQLEVARTMLRRNTANLNGKERRMGRTPLHFACALTCKAAGVVSSNCLPEGRACEGGRSSSSPTASDELNGNAENFDGGGENGSCHAVRSSTETELGATSDLPTDSAVNGVLKENVCTTLDHFEHSPPSTSRSENRPRRKTGVVNGHLEFSASGTPRPRGAWNDQSPRALTPRQHFASDARHGRHSAAEPSPRTQLRAGGPGAATRPQTRHSIAGDRMLFHRPLSQQAVLLTTPSRPAAPNSSRASRVHRPSTAPASHPRHQLSSTFPLSHPGFKIPSLSTGRESANSYRSRENLAIVPVTPLNVGLIRYKLVELLLLHGADANLMTFFRKAPLHLIALQGAADVMALLLPHVTNPNTLSASNKTALHFAVEGGRAALVAQLIQAGANLMLRDIAGMTALHLAARLGHADIVALLLKAKAYTNSCDFRQMMPLHHACLQGHEEVIRLLLRAGARTDRVDNEGFRPLEYCGKARAAAQGPTIEKGYPAVLERLTPRESSTTLGSTTALESPDSARVSSRGTYADTSMEETTHSDNSVHGEEEDLFRLSSAHRLQKEELMLNLTDNAIRHGLVGSRQQTPRRSRRLCNGIATHTQAI